MKFPLRDSKCKIDIDGEFVLATNLDVKRMHAWRRKGVAYPSLDTKASLTTRFKSFVVVSTLFDVDNWSADLGIFCVETEV